MQENYPNRIVLRELEQSLRELLDGHASLTEGVRNVVQWAFSNHGLDVKLFNHLIGFDSGTDRYPLGEVRGRWSASALLQADEDRSKDEALHKDRVLKAARALLDAVTAISPTSFFTRPNAD